jgi:hypothetical protein
MTNKSEGGHECLRRVLGSNRAPIIPDPEKYILNQLLMSEINRITSKYMHNRLAILSVKSERGT